MFSDVAARLRDALAGSIREHGERIERERVHATREDDAVVFVVGMRINAFRKLHRWIPIALVAPRLVRRLETDRDSGLLGSWTFVSPPRTIGFVQYWESFDALRAYARDSGRGHVDAWQDYTAQADEGAVGIWHETYCVETYETVYNNVPPRGLGTLPESELVPATGPLESAEGRLDASRTTANVDAEPEPPGDS